MTAPRVPRAPRGRPARAPGPDGRAAWPRRLVAWFRKSHRPMPWRDAPTPYNVWISETMLQQTRVETVIPYFARFIARFPDLASLAAADEQDVLRLWQGLGYYSRARNLLRAARLCRDERGGTLPRTAADWRQLPGVGPYCAGAIASIAHGEREPAVDGNVIRVCTRLWALGEDFRSQSARARLAERLRPCLAGVNPSHFNQALMEVGALLCLPRTPRCAQCPLAADCQARRDGTQALYPRRTPAPALPQRVAAVAAIRRRGRLLLARRRPDRLLGGLWELPGGCHAAEADPRKALERKVEEETGLRVRADAALGTVTHVFSHFRIAITVYACRDPGGRARPLASTATRWCRDEDAAELPCATVTRRLLALAARAARQPFFAPGEELFLRSGGAKNV